MATDQVVKCETCAHSTVTPTLVTYECHGAPPQVIVTPNGIGAMFPIVPASWGCAMWAPKAPAPAEKPQDKPALKLV